MDKYITHIKYIVYFVDYWLTTDAYGDVGNVVEFDVRWWPVYLYSTVQSS